MRKSLIALVASSLTLTGCATDSPLRYDLNHDGQKDKIVYDRTSIKCYENIGTIGGKPAFFLKGKALCKDFAIERVKIKGDREYTHIIAYSNRGFIATLDYPFPRTRGDIELKWELPKP